MRIISTSKLKKNPPLNQAGFFQVMMAFILCMVSFVLMENLSRTVLSTVGATLKLRDYQAAIALSNQYGQQITAGFEKGVNFKYAAVDAIYSDSCTKLNGYPVKIKDTKEDTQGPFFIYRFCINRVEGLKAGVIQAIHPISNQKILVDLTDPKNLFLYEPPAATSQWNIWLKFVIPNAEAGYTEYQKIKLPKPVKNSLTVSPLLPLTVGPGAEQIDFNNNKWKALNGQEFSQAYTWESELVCGKNAVCFSFRFCAKTFGECKEEEYFYQRIGFAKPISPQ